MIRIGSAAALAFVAATVAFAFEPPKVVLTSPKRWAIGVEPSRQKTVTITFDQRMRTGFWDFIGRDTLSPPTNLETKMSADRMSYDLSVRLQPGKVYIMGLNERGIPGVGFQNEKGLSLSPTYLVFQTAGRPAPEDAPPRVLVTFPTNGAEDVNPATTKAITATFDRAMETKKHGLHLFEGKQPVDLRSAMLTYSADGKTFTLAYAFKPSTHYEVAMNNNEDIGFAATNRAPLWPVHFAFTTGQPH
jgi:Bacterial Ig-like domain